jgi:acetyltransferase-like isoleucine patch superfamily enzyme
MNQRLPHPRRSRSFAALCKRTFEVGVVDLLLGLWLRRWLPGAGVLKVSPGWPLQKIINKGGKIEVGDCRLSPGVRIECWQGGAVKIGKGTFLNRGVEIVASISVHIGVDCKIARDVVIMDTDQHAIDGSQIKKKPVCIEDRVWLGTRVIVLKGVSIGHDSIIGAGAIVTRSIPPRSVVVSPAARVIKTLSIADEHCPPKFS